MCRLLCVRSASPFPILEYLPRFAEMAKNSVEYQGDGWGYAALEENGWRVYRNLSPVWEDMEQTNHMTTLLLMHARSAFQNSGIGVANNMPFTDNHTAFIFNGELRGVRIRAEGRIGAEKVFNLIRSHDKHDLTQAVTNALKIIEQRTSYLRAANLIMSDGQQVVLASRFNENPDYFTLHRTVESGRVVICSEPLSGDGTWQAIPQGVHQVTV